MVAGYAERLLVRLAVFQEEGVGVRGEVDVGEARDHAISTGNSPLVGVLLVDDGLHGLSVLWRIEKTFVLGLKFADVVAHLLKGAVFGVPCYAIVSNCQS